MGPGFSASSVLVVLLSGLAIAQDSLSNEKPPGIKAVRSRNVYFVDDQNIDLPCVAEGNPKPVYYWLKNGERLNMTSRMTMESGVGSLVIPVGTEEDEGVYQCVAENRYGKSLSVKRIVQRARLEMFPDVDETLKVTALLGRPLKLACAPPVSVPKARIQWIIHPDSSDYYEYDEDEDLGFNFVHLDDRITMDWTGNLYITNLREEDGQDGGRYVCMAQNMIVRAYNQGEDTIVRPLGRLANVPVQLMWHSDTNALGLLEKRARFKCIFSGNPQPTIRWQRVDGNPMDVTRMKQYTNGFDFEIANVKYSDQGTYECIGSSSVNLNSVTHRFTLRVESQPIWDVEPRDTEVGVGESAVFECKASGTPKPKIQWHINGNPLEEEPPNPRRSLNNGKLVFTHLTKSDSQVIQCNASNVHGFLWSDVFLHVVGTPARVKVAPPDILKVVRSQSATLTCQVEGRPTPTVTWFRGLQRLRGERFVLQPSGDLTIKDVRRRDGGRYRCLVQNRFGEDRANVRLVVREQTRIILAPRNEALTNGSKVAFTCGAMSDAQEPAHITWLKNGAPVNTSDPRIKTGEKTLVIDDIRISDTANYTCVADNGVDNDTATAKLQVRAPPEPPYDVSVNCFERRASIRWRWEEGMENLSPLQGFQVEYNSSTHPGEWRLGQRVGVYNRRAEINIYPFMTYTFRVRAVNAIGVGGASDHTPDCSTPPSRPLHHPRGVRTVEDKEGYVVVEWEPLTREEISGPGVFYNITARELNGPRKFVEVERDYKVGRKEIYVGSIYAPFEVTVSAWNAIGKVPVSAMAVLGFSGEGVPKVSPINFELDPDKTLTATTAGFRWDPVDTSEEAMQGKFAGYKVRFWRVGEKNSSMHEVFIPYVPSSRGARSKIRADVNSLLSYSRLEADVVAVNGHVASAGSNVIRFSTPEGVPSMVSSLVAVRGGSTHVVLEWGEPTEPNGVLLGYKTGYRKLEMFSFGDMVEGETVADRWAFLGGLRPDSLYRAFVWGFTATGGGAKRYIDLKTTPSSVELSPPVIAGVDNSSTSLNVTWTVAFLKGHQAGSHYMVNYRKLDHAQWVTNGTWVEDGINWQVIEGLEEGTTYMVRVKSRVKESPTGLYKFAISDERTVTTPQVLNGGRALIGRWFLSLLTAIVVLLSQT